MVSAKCFVLLAIVALGTKSVTARHLLQTSTCPLPANQKLDLSGLVKPCSSNSTICTDCLCTLTIALVPAFVAGGVNFDPEDPSSLDVQKITDISTVCAQSLAPQIAAALGDKAALLTGLADCPLVADNNAGTLTTASLPECLTVESLTAAFAAANSTALQNVTANSTANSTLGDSDDLPNDMSLNSNTTSTDANATVIATEGPASAPATSSRTAAPAPAAKSGAAAAAAGMTAMATMGAAALAALLL